MKECLVVAVVIVALFAVVLTIGYYDDKAWQQYALDHHCVVVGKKEATTGIGSGISSNGNAVTTSVYIPEQTIYQCDSEMVIR